jgi:hypothetical protein
MINDLNTFIQVVLWAIGITYVVTGSRIGYPLRFVWCFLFNRWGLSRLWALATCPPCNAWWVGFFLAVWHGFNIPTMFQMAFTCCGVVATIQAVGLQIGLNANEDFDKIFGEGEE